MRIVFRDDKVLNYYSSSGVRWSTQSFYHLSKNYGNQPGRISMTEAVNYTVKHYKDIIRVEGFPSLPFRKALLVKGNLTWEKIKTHAKQNLTTKESEMSDMLSVIPDIVSGASVYTSIMYDQIQNEIDLPADVLFDALEDLRKKGWTIESPYHDGKTQV